MIDTFRRALPGQFLMLAQESGQLESLEMMGEQDLGGVAHAASSASPESSRM